MRPVRHADVPEVDIPTYERLGVAVERGAQRLWVHEEVTE